MDTIKQRMRAKEREVLKSIRAENKRGYGYDVMFARAPWYNAINRLRAAKKIRFSKAPSRYGYWIVQSQ